MSKPKPISRYIFFSLTAFLLLLTYATLTTSSPDPTSTTPDEEINDLEELMALDEEEDSDPQISVQETKDFKLSEAQVLSKAQRIVLELNNDNFKKAINENEFVFVLGYAPWCARSAELMPRFAEAATTLKEMGSSVLMAKIDADRYPKAASTLDIKGFPTLLLFANTSSLAYTGGFSPEEIVIWVRKKTGVPVIRIHSADEASEFLKRHPTFAVALFEKFEGPDYEEYVKAAKSDNEIQFVETNNKEVAKVLFPDVKSTNVFLGLVKSEPEKYTTFEGTFDEDGILQFLDDNKFPLVTILTELNSARVYSSMKKLQVYVFAEADELAKLLQPLQDIVRKFKSKIMLVSVDIREDNLAKPYLTLFGLEESKDTVVTAFDYSNNSKYLLESDPIPRNIEDFCSKLVHGTLPPFYKSQPIPDNENATVLTVVGKTFDELVLGSRRNILLEVHTPWCITCESTSKQVEKLAKHFQGLDSLAFARIDASGNEHPKLQVDDYPTLLFYPISDKSNPIKLDTKAGSKGLAANINKMLKTQEDSVVKDEL